jgi:hypothetical protein
VRVAEAQHYLRVRGGELAAWGLHSRAGWFGALAWVQGSTRDYAVAHLITLWYPGGDLEAVAGEDYGRVPRIRLAGPPETWPVLPSWYDGRPWPVIHSHYYRPSADGYWGTGPGAVHMRPGEDAYEGGG